MGSKHAASAAGEGEQAGGLEGATGGKEEEQAVEKKKKKNSGKTEGYIRVPGLAPSP